MWNYSKISVNNLSQKHQSTSSTHYSSVLCSRPSVCVCGSATTGGNVRRRKTRVTHRHTLFHTLWETLIIWSWNKAALKPVWVDWFSLQNVGPYDWREAKYQKCLSGGCVLWTESGAAVVSGPHGRAEGGLLLSFLMCEWQLPITSLIIWTSSTSKKAHSQMIDGGQSVNEKWVKVKAAQYHQNTSTWSIQNTTGKMRPIYI